MDRSRDDERVEGEETERFAFAGAPAGRCASRAAG